MGARGFEKGLDDPAVWDERGEPLLTAAEVIIREARIGLPAEIAAQIAGISLRTYRTWIQEGLALQQRRIANRDLELTDEQVRLVEFAQDVQAARSEWVSAANGILERAALTRQKVTRKTKTAKALVKGVLVEYEAEVTVTVEDLPVELGPLQWRLSKLAPAVYGPVSRIELTGAEGGPVTIDIGTRVGELLDRIRGSIEVEEVADPGPVDPEVPELEPGSNGHAV